jgi:hypothetical protein
MLPMQLMIGCPMMMTIENQKAKMRYLAKNPDVPFKEGGGLSALNFMVGLEIEIVSTSNGLQIFENEEIREQVRAESIAAQFLRSLQ